MAEQTAWTKDRDVNRNTGAGVQEEYFIGTWNATYTECTTGTTITATEIIIPTTGYILQARGKTGFTALFKNRGAQIITVRVYEAIVDTPDSWAHGVVARNDWVQVSESTISVSIKVGDVEGEEYMTFNRRHGKLVFTASSASGTLTSALYGKVTVNGHDP